MSMLPDFPTAEEWEAYKAKVAAKQQAIEENLPSWSQVEAALDGISNLAEAKTALKRIARVVYWVAKNQAS